MKYAKIFLIAFLIILIDQAVKMLVHFKMDMGIYGQIVVLGDWFKLHYTLNPGMAFGLELPAPYGKIGLSLFRIAAVIGIGFYLKHLIDQKAHRGLLVSMALILGGAIGNVIDSTFYGIWLQNAPEGAITPWFHGQVIDMFYVDIWEGIVADWVPFLGGKYYSFWPIFNVADASIFVGVFMILIFQGRFFPQQAAKTQKVQNSDSNTTLSEEAKES